MFLLILGFIASIVVGIGWSIPSLIIAFVKKFVYPRKKKSTDEMAFFADWMMIQASMGLITTIGFPIAFAVADTTIVARFLFLYFLASLFSAALLWAVMLIFNE